MKRRVLGLAGSLLVASGSGCARPQTFDGRPIEGGVVLHDGLATTYLRAGFAVTGEGFTLLFEHAGVGCRRDGDCLSTMLGTCDVTIGDAVLRDYGCDGDVETASVGDGPDDPAFAALEERYLELRRQAGVEASYLTWMQHYAPARLRPKQPLKVELGRGLSGALVVIEEPEGTWYRERWAGTSFDYRAEGLWINRSDMLSSPQQPAEELRFSFMMGLGCSTSVGFDWKSHHECDASTATEPTPAQVIDAWAELRVLPAFAQWQELFSVPGEPPLSLYSRWDESNQVVLTSVAEAIRRSIDRCEAPCRDFFEAVELRPGILVGVQITAEQVMVFMDEGGGTRLVANADGCAMEVAGTTTIDEDCDGVVDGAPSYGELFERVELRALLGLAARLGWPSP